MATFLQSQNDSELIQDIEDASTSDSLNQAKKKGDQEIACSAHMLEKDKHKLEKIGLLQNSGYTVNEKQADYFCSESARELIKMTETMLNI